ncbi:tcp-1 cpn60 chaperonin family protein, putative [Ichthyophthirius multifiliis]|uniref:CCT-beta n=1 Tax=Ichthyophthirius multifiliis TaxID=5932 RepID=G0QSG7_ICHMU|nr:tcp-1 cpn60 chaperonin family protein, putative [Ichthyophthirius multifiliis]EGR31846.1 tcp-1 cpn60 chaperonin family protein, putative [Ichthyophthirius multifiliis]|eukprot:XP_004035332.1 tcp-1 cpn60 chaperonin family protein, putative [Ichthyophthirius multifiliis]
MDMVGNVLPQVLKNEASEEKGEMARLSSFVGAIAVADLVKTTLGPKGMDKILRPTGPGPQSQNITVTNDGATILKSMYIDNPAAKILIEISKTQDEEVGDGTTTVAVFAGELLREGEKLINQKIHPQHIINGWRKARDAAQYTLNKIARDNSTNETKFREDLLNIARTTLSSKLLTQDKEHFARLAVEAVLRLKGSANLDQIQVIKKSGGSIKDSYLADGLILEKQITVGCPKRIENAKILVANTPMDYDKIKIYGTKVKVESMDKVAEIEAAEKEKMKNKVDKILSYEPTVFINRQLIYNYPEQMLADKGIMVIEHADFDGIERLAAATGAEILSTFDSPERSEQIMGKCKLIQEIMIGEDKFVQFSGCQRGEACTIILRGASSHIIDEAERSLHDALCVLVTTVKNSKVVYGGGNSEIQMSLAVDLLTQKVKGKQALAIEAYAKALRQLPTIIADNGGYDAADLVQTLKVEISEGKTSMGLDMMNGGVEDMEKLGVTECLRVKEQALLSASEAAELILRVDSIIRAAPRQRNRM